MGKRLRPRRGKPGPIKRDSKRGRKPWDPMTVDPTSGTLKSELAIAARRSYNSMQDIVAAIYPETNLATVYRHLAKCGRCAFCVGMRTAPAASRLFHMGKLQEYAGDPKSPWHYKALALLATHAPSSPLRQRVALSQDDQVDDTAPRASPTWWAKPRGGAKAWKPSKRKTT